MFWILVNKEPRKVEQEICARWCESNSRVVKQTYLKNVMISTVFLTINHSLYDDRPILFETMVFQSDDTPILCQRYATWDEAEKNHDLIVKQYEQLEDSSEQVVNNLLGKINA